MKLPISAIVVGYNESKTLAKALESIKFCEEILYVDLGSNDNSVKIASLFTNNIVNYHLVPSGEYAHARFVPTLKNDWVLYIDPDEELDPELIKEFYKIYPSIEKSNAIASVSVPWIFYFKKFKLIGTPWGINNYKPILANRQRFFFEPITHYGRRNKNGYTTFQITNTNAVLHHFWVQSVRLFLSKHFRYLKKEGTDRYNMGKRTNVFKVLLCPFKEFNYSFFTCLGYKNNFLGLFLSFFWSFYQFFADLSLYLKQKII
jgi:glycosyltransferase involved in cell wall biosynthesis